MLDEHGEALYFDLLEYKHLDLSAFIAGEVRGSVKMILHLIRHLPEDSSFAAIMSAKVESGDVTPPEPEPEEVARIDAMIWNFDRKLMAQVVNAVNLNTRVSTEWQKGKEPDFPIIGPSSWREPPEAHSKPEETKLSVLDVMKAWGYDGGL